MEDKIRQGNLYEFYGELLNEHQKRIYEDYVLNDLSLGEIAENENITRQGVYDLVRRATLSMEGYEERLHLMEKFFSVKARVEVLKEKVKDGAGKNEIMKILDEISGEL
jgi:hypothetical protein